MNTLIGKNRLFAPLFADPEIAAVFSTGAVLAQIIAFEVALTRALTALRLIEPQTGQQAIEAMQSFEMTFDDFDQDLQRDGLPIPAIIGHLKSAASKEVVDAIHVSSTSQDVIDTAICLSLQSANKVFKARLDQVIAQLDALDQAFGSNPLMGRTRMQAALTIPVSQRLRSWRSGLQSVESDWNSMVSKVEVIQFGGPVGDLRGYDGAAEDVADLIATELRLTMVPPWHTDRGRFLEYGAFLTRLVVSLGKIGTDVSLMSQQGLDAARLTGGGGSSAMPRKSNPIKAELLMTLTRYMASLNGALFQSGVHEQERSGVNWTLEWLVLPSLVECAGCALNTAIELLNSIEALGET